MSIPIGSVYGKWTTTGLPKSVRYPSGRYQTVIPCRCQCGIEKEVMRQALVSGASSSCGCHRIEVITKHSASKTKTYAVWYGMVRRCTDKGYDGYANYGAMGVTVSRDWLEFSNFLADMGEVPEGLTLDRIDGTKGYYKENCRWATPKEQANNRKNNRKVEHGGELLTCTQLAERYGINRSVIWNRLFTLKWPIEKALGLNTNALELEEGSYTTASRGVE